MIRTAPFLAVSADALSRAFSLKLKTWRNSRGNLPAPEDPRFQEEGFFRVPKLTPGDVEALRTLIAYCGRSLPKAWERALATDVLSEPVMTYARRYCTAGRVPEWVRRDVRRKSTSGKMEA